MYPEIMSTKGKEEDQPLCSAAQALTRQESFINQKLAYQALGMLTQLLRQGSLKYQVGLCNCRQANLRTTADDGGGHYHFGPSALAPLFAERDARTPFSASTRLDTTSGTVT